MGGGCWNVGQRLRVVGSGYGQDTLHTCMKLTKNIFKAKNIKKNVRIVLLILDRQSSMQNLLPVTKKGIL